MMSEDSTQKDNDLATQYNAAMKAIEEDQEAFWNSLSKEDQLKAFCAVSRRIFDGEIKVRGTYRYVLYNVFGFEPNAYAQAQHAGFLSIHNAIVGEDYDVNLLRSFCKHFDIPLAEEKIREWIL